MRVVFALVFTILVAFASEISIATYNVQNLFDCKDDGSEYLDFKVGVSKWDCEAADSKLQRTRQVINALNTDIIALQEIENEQVLKALVSDSEYKFISFTKEKNSPVGLGLISKLQPSGSEIFKVPNVKTRNILKVIFETEGKKFSIFVNHFPTYKNGINMQKKAEKTLRTALGKEKNAIILGDFNSPFGQKSILNDIIATRNFYDLYKELEPKDRYSHAVHGKKRAIDHVLLSPSFMENGDLSYVSGSFEVFKPSFAVDEKGFAKSDLYSDHFALKFKISTDPSPVKKGFVSKIFKKDENKANKKTSEQDYKTADVDTLFDHPEAVPAVIEKAVIILKDKHGFIISKNHRGIYVYDPKNSVIVGEELDILVRRMKIYKDALEVSSYEIINEHGTKDISENLLDASQLSEARSGDVFAKISGRLERGYLHTPYGKIRVYSKKKLKDGEYSFENVRVKIYKRENQIVVE
ncbi:endonuclease/exonuclease/phosphatase family protein [Campylobacter concisus]|uniref:endonuclease/exonuclease/phosphatase family protein n=1 Tax=Campylobacter concisus TaxID=199 RepID=UPI000CD95BCD|nr:endonuclease/exonuclease/phosphatase family protein [Campylobacter concisus]